MTELRFTRKAVEDLSDIWRYTVERWSEEQADRYYGLLVATCRKIAASTVPIGRRYEQIAEGCMDSESDGTSSFTASNPTGSF